MQVERQWNRSSINRPYLVRWNDCCQWGVVLQWGNRNCDPVWAIGISGRRRHRG